MSFGSGEMGKKTKAAAEHFERVLSMTPTEFLRPAVGGILHDHGPGSLARHALTDEHSFIANSSQNRGIRKQAQSP